MKTDVIITDMDGTLLDPRTYSFDSARPALRLVRELSVPLVLCSSKTRAEILYYREKLSNAAPFISENGGGVFIPEGYFPFDPGGEKADGLSVITLGTGYGRIREVFTRVREKTGVDATGFGDMTAKDVAIVASLPLEEAELAVQRDFDEPFFFAPGETAVQPFLLEIEAEGLKWTKGGRYYHVLGENDKGRAVRVLLDLYRRAHGEIRSIGIGDSLNDLALLKEVDVPVLVQKADGGFDPAIDLPGLVRADGIGPSGWNSAVLELMEE